MRAGTEGFGEWVSNLKRLPENTDVAVNHIGCQVETDDDEPVLSCDLDSRFGFYGRGGDKVFVSGSAAVESRLGFGPPWPIGGEGVSSFEYDFSSPVVCRVDVSGGGEESAFVSTVLRCRLGSLFFPRLRPDGVFEGDGIPRREERLGTPSVSSGGGGLIGSRERQNMAAWQSALRDYGSKMREDRGSPSG